MSKQDRLDEILSNHNGECSHGAIYVKPLETKQALEAYIDRLVLEARVEFVDYLQTTINLDAMQEDKVRTSFDEGKTYLAKEISATLEREKATLNKTGDKSKTYTIFGYKIPVIKGVNVGDRRCYTELHTSDGRYLASMGSSMPFRFLAAIETYLKRRELMDE